MGMDWRTLRGLRVSWMGKGDIIVIIPITRVNDIILLQFVLLHFTNYFAECCLFIPFVLYLFLSTQAFNQNANHNENIVASTSISSFINNLLNLQIWFSDLACEYQIQCALCDRALFTWPQPLLCTPHGHIASQSPWRDDGTATSHANLLSWRFRGYTGRNVWWGTLSVYRRNNQIWGEELIKWIGMNIS